MPPTLHIGPQLLLPLTATRPLLQAAFPPQQPVPLVTFLSCRDSSRYLQLWVSPTSPVLPACTSSLLKTRLIYATSQTTITQPSYPTPARPQSNSTHAPSPATSPDSLHQTTVNNRNTLEPLTNPRYRAQPKSRKTHAKSRRAPPQPHPSPNPPGRVMRSRTAYYTEFWELDSTGRRSQRQARPSMSWTKSQGPKLGIKRYPFYIEMRMLTNTPPPQLICCHPCPLVSDWTLAVPKCLLVLPCLNHNTVTRTWPHNTLTRKRSHKEATGARGIRTDELRG